MKIGEITKLRIKHGESVVLLGHTTHGDRIEKITPIFNPENNAWIEYFKIEYRHGKSETFVNEEHVISFDAVPCREE